MACQLVVASQFVIAQIACCTLGRGCVYLACVDSVKSMSTLESVADSPACKQSL